MWIKQTLFVDQTDYLWIKQTLFVCTFARIDYRKSLEDLQVKLESTSHKVELTIISLFASCLTQV